MYCICIVQIDRLFEYKHETRNRKFVTTRTEVAAII